MLCLLVSRGVCLVTAANSSGVVQQTRAAQELVLSGISEA